MQVLKFFTLIYLSFKYFNQYRSRIYLIRKERQFFILWFGFYFPLSQINQSIIQLAMKFRCSDIFNTKSIKSSIYQQNSSFSSPYQSKHPQQFQDNEIIQILNLKVSSQVEKEKVHYRSHLPIQYLPQFKILSENNQQIKIRTKQYSLQLLPWLIKKDSIFKINIVLGIYIAFLQLIQAYGLFPIHPNMMRVNKKQQVAVWINKNFQSFQPDQVLKINIFSMKQFMKSFLKIFRCCLPNRKMPEMYNDSKQLLSQLAKLKRKQQIHRNCHEFLKHDCNISSSRKSNKNYSTLFAFNEDKSHQKKQTPNKLLSKERYQNERYSTKITTSFKEQFRSKSNSPFKNESSKRLKSFSPPKNLLSKSRQISLQNRFGKISDIKFTSEKNVNKAFPPPIPTMFKKQSQKSSGYFDKNKDRGRDRDKRSFVDSSKQQISITSTGDLFKRYLMYNTTKFHKMVKTSNIHTELQGKHINANNKSAFIFKSDVYRVVDNYVSQPIIQQPSCFEPVAERRSAQINTTNQFSPIKFRKMSSNTGDQKVQNQSHNKSTFFKSSNWKKKFNEQDSFILTEDRQRQESPQNQPRQKLKTSFPYKTASTLTTFRLSNQHQMQVIHNKSQQNLLPTSNTFLNLAPLCLKQKQKKTFAEMKIVEQNQLENQFNNIFSMQNSNLRKDEEDQKKLELMIEEFEEILF